MKTPATIALVAVLFAVGCETATLIGREWPPGSGSPDGATTDTGPQSTVPPDATPVQDGNTFADAGVDAPLVILGPPPSASPLFTIPDALIGEWSGYLEAFQLASGSDAISIRLIRTPGQPDRIEAVLGMGPASGPTGIDPWSGAGFDDFLAPRPPYAEGYPYLAYQVSWMSNRVVFRISQNDAWQNWCAAHASHPAANKPSGFSCAGTFDDQSLNGCLRPSQQGDAGNTVPPGCIALAACELGTVCTCDATRCAATFALNGTIDVTFDAPASGALSIDGYAAFRLNRKNPDAGAPDGAGP